MKYLLMKLLPKNLLSRAMGHLADWEAPQPLLQSIIKNYSSFYGIDLEEMKTPVSQMKSFNQFFTRELKEGLRPVDQGEEVLTSPVDGAIAEAGPIEDGLLVQTKGIYYSLSDLVGPEDAKLYQEGYFMTIYLSPADYHRIHTPFAGKVTRFSYFSGNLWPVNKFGVEEIGGLFAVNERMVTPVETEGYGSIGMVKVGATVVGKIKTTFTELASNQGHRTQLNIPVEPAREYQKGEEIGRFQLGSTVILLFEKDVFQPDEYQRDQKVRMGVRLGTLKKKG